MTPLPRHHFGCQMNAHDSRADQGHARVARARRGAVAGGRRRPRLQHLHDPREARHEARRLPRRRGRAQAREPGRRRSPSAAATPRRSASGSSSSTRRSTSRSGPGSIPHLGDWLGAGGDGVARGALRHRTSDFAGDLPMHRERALPGLGAGLDGLQLEVRVLHRPGRARPRAEPPAGRDRRRGDAARRATACERSRCSARTSTPGAATCGPTSAPSSASCCAPATRSTGSSGSASRARTRRTSASPVIAAMAECDAVCEHVHLPLQSGSTRILKAMRRTYDRERYLALVGELRDAIPDLALGTDIIVGFPGETEDDFRETLEVVEEVALRQRLHVRLLAAARAPRRPRCPTRCRTRSSTSGSSGWSTSCSGSPPSGTPSASAASRRCSSRGRAAPTRRCCAAARAATRRSTSPASAEPGELVDVLIEGATSTTLRGAQRTAVAA